MNKPNPKFQLPSLQTNFYTIQPQQIQQILRKYTIPYQPKGASLSTIKKKVELQKYCESIHISQRRRVISVTESIHTTIDQNDDDDWQLLNQGKYQLLSDLRNQNKKQNINQITIPKGRQWILDQPKKKQLRNLFK